MYKDQDIYEMKVHDMVKVYREIAPDCWTQKQALQEVVSHAAPRFYILPHAAYTNLRLLFAGQPLKSKIPTIVRMYGDLYKIVVGLSQHPEHEGKSLRQLCKIAVTMPAPEFYCSTETFRAMLYAHKKKIIASLNKHHAHQR